MANIRLSWLASAGAQSAEHKSEEDRAEKSSSYPNLLPSILHVIRVAVACDPKGTLKLDQVLRRIHSDQRPYPPELDQTYLRWRCIRCRLIFDREASMA